MADGVAQKVRAYFVAKEVRAETVPPGTVVWLQLPSETADSPEEARAQAAEREDKEGGFSPDTRYFVAGRPKIGPVVKDVKVTFR